MYKTLIYIGLLLITCQASGQDYQRYKKEPGQVFQFEVFQRGFNPKMIRSKLDTLQSIDQSKWSRDDSLNFAISLLQIGRNIKSAIIFNEIPSPEIRSRKTLMYKLMAFEKTQKFGLAMALIKELSVRLPADQIKWSVWKQTLIARRKIANDEENEFNKTPIIPMNAMNNMTQDKLLSIIRKINELIHFKVRFYIDDEPVLAELCYELGIIFRDRLTLTQAYIALNLARNYDRSFGKILNTLKEVKSKLNHERYEIPPFRKVFPKVHERRFDYKLLNEKKSKEELDSVINNIPQLMKEPDKKPPLLQYGKNIMIAVSLFVVLILVVIFVRTKK